MKTQQRIAKTDSIVTNAHTTHFIGSKEEEKTKHKSKTNRNLFNEIYITFNCIPRKLC